MTEIDEIINGLTLEDLLKELQFQILSGEKVGNSICSYFVKAIENKGGVLITEKAYYEICTDYRGIWTTERNDDPDWEKVRKKYIGKKTMMKDFSLIIEGLHFVII